MARGAGTVDDQRMVLISAAMRCPLAPRPTRGTQLRGWFVPPPWYFINMSSPLRPFCPISAKVTITSRLVHPVPLSVVRGIPLRVKCGLAHSPALTPQHVPVALRVQFSSVAPEVTRVLPSPTSSLQAPCALAPPSTGTCLPATPGWACMGQCVSRNGQTMLCDK